MEKSLKDRLYDALQSVAEFSSLSMDTQAELILSIEPSLKIDEGIMFVCQSCLRSSKQEPVNVDDYSESFLCPHCGATTTYFEDGSSTFADKKKYQIKIICGECKKSLGSKETDLPEMDGMISDSLCEKCANDVLESLKNC